MTITHNQRLISPSTLAEIESALKNHCSDILSTALTPYTENLCIDNATNFARWLRGEFHPGARTNPYQARPKPVQLRLIDVSQAASLLGVSETWVRRHLSELPIVRLGRLVRIDSSALSQQIAQSSLKPERSTMISRYQRGYVRQRGKHKVWYGIYRENTPGPDGKRHQLQVRLGTPAELPTKNAARAKLAEIMSVKAASPASNITFTELVDRWEKAEGPAMKPSTLDHYLHSLRVVRLEFAEKRLTDIHRESVQTFLNEKAVKYSASSLRSMRAVLGLTLGWAERNGWIPRNPCVKIKLPRETGGRRVERTVLTPEQLQLIVMQLEEPYATLVPLLYVTGLRISEAAALKWTDLHDGVLTISRRMYARKIDDVKSERSKRKLALDPAMVERLSTLRSQFANNEWMFQSQAGTPIDPHNALERYMKPAAQAIGIKIGGWHDFRHTLSTGLRRAGVHPKVISDILGHSKVNLAMDTYDRTDVSDTRAPLAKISRELLAWSAS